MAYFSAAGKKQAGAKRTLLRRGGEGGIRTHVGLHPTRFRVFYSEHTLMDFTPETRILPEDNFSLKILSCFPQMTTI